MVTEGSEEGASNLLNSFADILISGDQSQWSQNVEYYRSQGYSDERAFEYALGDQAPGLGLDVLGGMLSGGLLSGGYGGVNFASSRGDSRIARDDTAVGNVRPMSQSNMIQELTATAHTPLERRALSQYKNALELLESRQRVLSDTQNQIHLLESTGRTGSAEYNKLKSAEMTLSRKVSDAQRKVDLVENGTTIQKLQEKTLVYDKTRDIIEQEEIIIGRSVGAKAKNYKVKDLTTGETFYFAEGTKLQDVEVFAGKGANTAFRKAPKYANLHGGKTENWQHVKGFGYLDTPDGEYYAEVHWVQCEGIGKFDFFVKRWIE